MDSVDKATYFLFREAFDYDRRASLDFLPEVIIDEMIVDLSLDKDAVSKVQEYGEAMKEWGYYDGIKAGAKLLFQMLSE